MTGSPRALEGIRILDLGTITAGAATSVVFADFGADVVKVEWPGQLDPFRAWTQIAADANHGVNSSPPFQVVNRGKRSVGINLKSEAGRKLLLELVAESDIVVENFRRGVLERLGLDFDTLRTANARIVLLSLTSQGAGGPVARYGSFGSTLDALGGLMSVTGYGSSEPTWSSNNLNYPDQLVSFLAPGVALAALRQVRQTGEAVWVDFSQRESVTFSMGEYFVEYARSGSCPAPQGNRGEGSVRGVYPTAQHDRWLAVSIPRGSEQEQAALDLLAGGLDIGDEELEDLLAAWAARRDPLTAESELRFHGIAASLVRNSAETMQDAQLEELDFFQRVPSRRGPITQRGFSVRLGGTPGSVRGPAPDLGEHTRRVLHDLGVNDADFDWLLATDAVFVPEEES